MKKPVIVFRTYEYKYRTQKEPALKQINWQGGENFAMFEELCRNFVLYNKGRFYNPF